MDFQRRTFVLRSLALSTSAALMPSHALANSLAAGGRFGQTAVRSIPEGYIRVGNEQHVPPIVLFGVALQESERLFGAKSARRYLPWPWTLNVRGRPYRLTTRAAAQSTLVGFLRQGIRLADIGLMQVNWHYFENRLLTPPQALEPYWNLRVGASILREHYRDTADWFAAIGRYHSPANSERAGQYAQSVMLRIARTLRA